MAKMNFRFRKSFPIVPGILRFTISKKGWSVNLNLGIFSKSWGNIRQTTTLDMPGTTGIFWRKEQSTKKSHEEKAQSKVIHSKAHKQIFILSLWVTLLAWGVGLWQIYIHPFSNCKVEGSPATTFSIFIAIQAVLFVMLFRGMKVARGIGGVIVIGIFCLIQWQLFGHFISPNLNCR